ncbi:DNA-processing protein DprA [Williamsia sp. 1135]|uniref:DNA-processing protein DprA n=1 Tax=Williamsia sp. 1135 TaxID=1889262 RepID=UPI000A109C9F|nr:DNA-processing protein DprA [Williamsia sp. 1135]ORM23882.1 DNA protecting protein DprA [Williamsia sp. 1135]
MIDEQQRRAWAYLAAVAEPPSAAIVALIADVGVQEAAAAVASRSVPPSHAAVLQATEARWETNTAAADLDAVDRIGGRLVTPDDDEWPGWQLLSLGNADTAVKGGEPTALWVRGPARLDEAVARSVGMVGSRAASAYGEHVTASISGDLVVDGWSVLSGGAYGIDGVAHRNALAAEGTTVAVLACGIDRDYPTGHARLLAEIARTGLVVSEYAPGTSAAKHRFLTRNRLVAALSRVVAVVEAGRRSGAANTAAWARKLGTPLGAVPGPVTSATSVGCHRMIADGLAQLVTDASDIVRLAEPDGASAAGAAAGVPRRGGSGKRTDELDPQQLRVYEAIPAKGAVTVGEVAFTAGLDVRAVRSGLAALEARGFVTLGGSGWMLAPRR